MESLKISAESLESIDESLGAAQFQLSEIRSWVSADMTPTEVILVTRRLLMLNMNLSGLMNCLEEAWYRAEQKSE